jgi:hypothetical protein
LNTTFGNINLNKKNYLKASLNAGLFYFLFLVSSHMVTGTSLHNFSWISASNIFDGMALTDSVESTDFNDS